MAKRELTPKLIPKTFAELRDAVLAVVVRGRRAIDQAWVESYHEIGRLIHEHLLFKQGRAAYGAGVFADLAEASGISSRTLHECVQFNRLIPIVRHGAQFNWSHYRVFCQVEDESQRLTLMAKAAELGWTSPQLIEQVRALNAAIDIEATAVDAKGGATGKAHKPLVPQPGTPGVRRVATVDGRRVADQGFASYRDLNPEQADAFKDGALVQIGAGGRITAAEGATKADLFNYRVEIIRVVDGDTLWVRIYLRPGEWIKQKLRLRGLDCPELSTPEGKAAKRFVEALFTKTTAITINTTKADKYDRYLADVFLEGDFTSLFAPDAQPGESPLFLNNVLLENGHAVRKDAWEFGDWEPEILK